jgi:cytoskeleton protein RodZ
MEQQTENNAVPVENVGAPVSTLPGALLREARERLGLSIADAAAHTKLAPRQIEALEADDYQHLPEMAFVRGFVRSYAKLLQLDVPPLLAALPQTQSVSHVSPDSVDVPFPDARSPQLQNLIWLGAALFLSVVVVAFAVWHYTSPGVPDESGETAQVETAKVETAIPLPSGMQLIPASEVAETAASSVAPTVAQSAVPSAVTVTAPAATLPVLKQPQPVSAVKPTQPVAAAKPVPTTPVAKPLPLSAVSAVKPAPVAAKPTPTPVVSAAKPVAPAATTAVQSANLRLTFGEESWTEVRDKNGNIVSSQLNPAGSELRLSGQGPFTLVVGRASSARLTYKGKTVDLKPTTNATSDVARVTLE